MTEKKRRGLKNINFSTPQDSSHQLSSSFKLIFGTYVYSITSKLDSKPLFAVKLTAMFLINTAKHSFDNLNHFIFPTHELTKLTSRRYAVGSCKILYFSSHHHKPVSVKYNLMEERSNKSGSFKLMTVLKFALGRLRCIV